MEKEFIKKGGELFKETNILFDKARKEKKELIIERNGVESIYIQEMCAVERRCDGESIEFELQANEITVVVNRMGEIHASTETKELQPFQVTQELIDYLIEMVKNFEKRI